tara:strand:- start:3968 stop:4669 length:702 start_codon:yes stop_codon:yes gene_type:complete
MPLYEFTNKETGESAGELMLPLSGLDEFLERNPQLSIKPGKLRLAVHKSAESFPSYPDMDNETRTSEEKHHTFKPPQPASWNDDDKGETGYKVIDKRVNKFSHFDEDIKKYGRIVGTPKMLGDSESDFAFDSVDSSEPISYEEEAQQYEIESKKDKQGTWERETLGQKGWNSKDPLSLNPTLDTAGDTLMPWEKGFAKANKKAYDEGAVLDRERAKADRTRERVKLGLEDPED